MFLVGGGIVVHGIGPLHHAIEGLAHHTPGFGGLVTSLADAVVGIVAGVIVLAVVEGGKKVFKRG
jgi:predicted DNA repair protein MutK